MTPGSARVHLRDMPTQPPIPRGKPHSGRRSRDVMRLGLIAAGCSLALLWSWARLRESDPKTALLRDIAGGNVEARRRAVLDLGDQPPDQIAAVLKGLSGALDDADSGVREQAALAIGRATSFASDWLKASERPEGDAAIRTLSAHRADGSPAVRRAVASSVALCATLAREAASHARIAGTLRALMADPDASVRLVATRSLDDPLYRRDPANDAAFEDATSDLDPAVRLPAGFAAIQQEALTKRGERMILKLLDDPDPLVHKLGESGSGPRCGSRRTIPSLTSDIMHKGPSMAVILRSGTSRSGWTIRWTIHDEEGPGGLV